MLDTAFSKRRQRVFDQLPAKSIVLLFSGSEVRKSGDQDYLFQPDTDFYYLTGFAEPDAMAALIVNEDAHEYLLFNRPRNMEMEIWNGRRAGQEGACKIYGANRAFTIEELDKLLPELLLGKNKIYYPVGRYAELDERVINHVVKLRNKIRSGIPSPQELINIESILHPMRRVKDNYEIELLRKAGEISAQAHVEAMQACKPGMLEYEIEAKLIYEFRRKGCKWPAYNPIVGGGENACILHYNENNMELQDGDLLLVDAGGEYQGYAADITRTYPVNGKFSQEQRLIYDLVLEAQLAVLELVKPGTAYISLQETAIRVITTGLVKLGIMQGDVDELIQTQAYKTFYMHNIGHWLGLDTHDAGSYREQDEWVKLEPGNVLTVEPGIYISAGTPNIAKKWWNIGVRIEDNVLVTQSGCDILTKTAPKTVSEIETLMAG
jgi:Xaa-Pro aminopeptidase